MNSDELIVKLSTNFGSLGEVHYLLRQMYEKTKIARISLILSHFHFSVRKKSNSVIEIIN